MGLIRAPSLNHYKAATIIANGHPRGQQEEEGEGKYGNNGDTEGHTDTVCRSQWMIILQSWS